MLLIPTSFDGTGKPLPAFQQVVKLDGVNFLLSFLWNRRGEFWQFDIADSSGEALVSGLVLRTGYPLIIPRNIEGPTGLLIPLDDGKNIDPTLENFGIGVKMYYIEASEL